MNCNVFMNGLKDDVFIMDDHVDPNLVKVLPDFMNNLQNRRYQQPNMVPDVINRSEADYEYRPGAEFDSYGHPRDCQCPECRDRRMMQHMEITDMAYMQNQHRHFCIDLKSYAFDTQSTQMHNETMTLLRLFNSMDDVPVFSKRYFVRLLYTFVSVDENNCLIATQDGALQLETKRDFYMTHDQTAEGLWTYQFMDLHGSDVITIPTMYGAAAVSLNLRGIEVYGKTSGYSLTIKPDGNLVYVNTGIKDILIYKDMFGAEYRGYVYAVQPHDRIRINISTVFNNISFFPDLTKIRGLVNGLDYRTMDFDTVPSWNNIKLWTGTDISGPDFIRVGDTQQLQETMIAELNAIPLPDITCKGELKYAV